MVGISPIMQRPAQTHCTHTHLHATESQYAIANGRTATDRTRLQLHIACPRDRYHVKQSHTLRMQPQFYFQVDLGYFRFTAMGKFERLGFTRPLPAVLLALVFTHLSLINSVIDTINAPSRTLHSVELFSGEQAISHGVRAQSFPAGSFDKRYHVDEDLSTAKGFSLALIFVLQIARFGMLWGAPVCSSWVWVSRSRTGRSRQNALGNLRHLSVQVANRMVEYTTLLFVIAYWRGVAIYLEQPQSSVMPWYPCVRALFEYVDMTRLPVSLGSYGGDSAKPVFIWTSETNVRIHYRIKTSGTQKVDPLKRKALCVRSSTGAVTGNKKALKDSQHYPTSFGLTIADCCISSRAEHIPQEMWPHD